MSVIFKKLRNSTSIISNCIFILFFVSIMTGCASRKDRHDDSSNRLIKMEHQIEVLNHCAESALDRMHEFLIEALLAPPDVPTDYSLGGLFSISLPQKEKQKMLLNLWLSRHGDVEEFWKSLGMGPDTPNNRPLLTEDEFYEFKLTLFLARLTEYQMPLLIELDRLRKAENLNTLYSISRLSREQWRELVMKSDIDIDFEPYILRVEKTFDDLMYGGCKFD